MERGEALEHLEQEPEPTPSLDAARLRIAHLSLAAGGDLTRALRRATELSARTLSVSRVSVWLFAEGRRSLVIVAVHDAAPSGRSERTELSLDQLPTYARAINSRRAVIVDDVTTNPSTSELQEYVTTHGITSMLDVPIFLGGEVWGIVCHEHVGPKRRWSPAEVDFAISVADMLTALLEQARRLSAESALREKDAEVARARRDEVLTRMGASVGHDFNTILQSLTLLLGAAADEADPEKRRDLLTSALEETQRGARLTRRLLDFARAAHVPVTDLDLGEIVRLMDRGLVALLRPSQRLVVDIDPNPCLVASVRAELEQVVLNLVTNARDASRDDGEIRIRVARLDGPTLVVSDDGVGIPSADLVRIFDPFFSTKQAAGGTGLGLATVDSIVRSRGGRVEVESEVGRGTTFRVSWPARD